VELAAEHRSNRAAEQLPRDRAPQHLREELAVSFCTSGASFSPACRDAHRTFRGLQGQIDHANTVATDDYQNQNQIYSQNTAVFMQSIHWDE
jgi:hypothetical protein